ncbi:MAG: hypothetical protein IH594_12720, partial [Bacteroidales bacterium]|nr:hypothetical protein [Bacteroidales bacterium]
SVLFTYTSCEKDEPEAPELPPLEAFAMDFSDFSNPNYAMASKKSATDPYYNFGYSFVTVTAWNTVATLVMAIPTATYAAALNDTPEYLGDNTWEWNFNAQVQSFSYSARLVATRISNEEFKAEMFVSSSSSVFASFEDFKWFEGVIRYDHTHASWTLYESPSNPTALLTMEWNKDFETGLWDITYTNVKQGAAESGSYIKFEVTDDSQYDARYTISSNEGMVKIEWNRETKAGRVMSPIFFEDSLWRCWNALLQNTEC